MRLFIGNGTDLVTVVLDEDFLTMETVESICSILTSKFKDGEYTTRMEIDEAAHVVDSRVDNDPQVFFSSMAGNFFTSKRFGHCK